MDEYDKLIYHGTTGEEVDPVAFIYDTWVNNHMPTIWHNVLGHFIISNAMNFFPDLDVYVRVKKEDAGTCVMRSDFIKDVMLEDLFTLEFWDNPEYLMDDTMHDALEAALERGTLMEGTLRLTATPVMKLGAERLALTLTWLDKDVPEVSV